ncbi:MAG TPA: PilZ domain-containing protein [Terriglobales bacterium]|nr:PilZ domain-containing protein [Terriglobales bacterium]
MSRTDAHALGSVLLVSRDATASRLITDALQENALSVEISVDVPAALDRLSRYKFEALVVDFSLGDSVTACLQKLRASPANRTAITFAITSGREETAHALKQGFRFVFETPLTADSINHTLRVAYGLIVRERRRYFRFPVSVPAVLSRKADAEVYARTLNISEGGVALSTSVPLAPGSEGTVQFTLPDPPLRVSADAKVCWHNEDGEAGLSFKVLPFDLASELQGWLAQKLEEQLPPQVVERFRQRSRNKPGKNQ